MGLENFSNATKHRYHLIRHNKPLCELLVWASCKDLVVAEEVHVWFPPFIPVNKTLFIYNGVRQKQSNSHVKTVKALEKKLKEKRSDDEKFGISGVDILA